MTRKTRAAAALLCLTLPAFAAIPTDPNQRYSPFTSIYKNTVAKLGVAWTFRTVDAYAPPHCKPTAFYGDCANRGVSSSKSSDGKLPVIIAAIDTHLIDLKATGGKPIETLREGAIDLPQALRLPAGKNHYAECEQTSSHAINYSVAQPRGEGDPWHFIPQDPNDPAAPTCKTGSAAKTGAGNAWFHIAVDPPRDLIFVPAGSPSPDYFGNRLGCNRYADSIGTLKASAGKVVWSLQTVHHDLWDYDVSTAPLLFEMLRDGFVLTPGNA